MISTLLYTVFSIVLLLGVSVFFIVALVKAFSKKTTGWIVTAVLTGLVGLGMVVVAIAGVVVGVSRTASESAKLNQVLKTKNGGFQVTVPGSWKPLPDLNPSAEIVAGNMAREQYLMIFVEPDESIAIDLSRLLEATAERMAAKLSDSSVGEATSLTIDGHPALRCRITGKRDGIDLAYLHTCLKRDGQIIQLICWTLARREAGAFPIYEQVTATFRRAVGAADAPAAPGAGSR